MHQSTTATGIKFCIHLILIVALALGSILTSANISRAASAARLEQSDRSPLHELLLNSDRPAPISEPPVPPEGWDNRQIEFPTPPNEPLAPAGPAIPADQALSTTRPDPPTPPPASALDLERDRDLAASTAAYLTPYGEPPSPSPGLPTGEAQARLEPPSPSAIEPISPDVQATMGMTEANAVAPLPIVAHLAAPLRTLPLLTAPAQRMD